MSSTALSSRLRKAQAVSSRDRFSKGMLLPLWLAFPDAGNLRFKVVFASTPIQSQQCFQIVNTKLSIEDFRIFCTVARMLHFSHAAQFLGVTPGYISKRILAMETELNCRLFHRSTRQVTLTEQGERAYELGMRILDNAEELHDEIM